MFSPYIGNLPPLSPDDERSLCMALYYVYRFPQERIAQFLGHSQSWVSKVCNDPTSPAPDGYKFAITIDGKPCH